MNDKNVLYGAIIRNAEALGDKNVSHDAVKKVSFQSLFKSCKGVPSWPTLSGSEFQTVNRESTAGKNCVCCIN